MTATPLEKTEKVELNFICDLCKAGRKVIDPAPVPCDNCGKKYHMSCLLLNGWYRGTVKCPNPICSKVLDKFKPPILSSPTDEKVRKTNDRRHPRRVCIIS